MTDETVRRLQALEALYADDTADEIDELVPAPDADEIRLGHAA